MRITKLFTAIIAFYFSVSLAQAEVGDTTNKALTSPSLENSKSEYCKQRMKLGELRGENDVECNPEEITNHISVRTMEILNEGLEVRSAHYERVHGRNPTHKEVQQFIYLGGFVASNKESELAWTAETNRLKTLQ